MYTDMHTESLVYLQQTNFEKKNNANKIPVLAFRYVVFVRNYINILCVESKPMGIRNTCNWFASNWDDYTRLTCSVVYSKSEPNSKSPVNERNTRNTHTHKCVYVYTCEGSGAGCSCSTYGKIKMCVTD